MIRRYEDSKEFFEKQLREKELEAREYRSVLLKCQRDGGTHNLQDEIDRVVGRYGDSGLAQNEEY